MGLILGIIVAVVTIVGGVLIMLANSMTDAPSVQSISPLPWLIGGFIISGLLIGSHYVHIAW